MLGSVHSEQFGLYPMRSHSPGSLPTSLYLSGFLASSSLLNIGISLGSALDSLFCHCSLFSPLSDVFMSMRLFSTCKLDDSEVNSDLGSSIPVVTGMLTTQFP